MNHFYFVIVTIIFISCNNTTNLPIENKNNLDSILTVNQDTSMLQGDTVSEIGMNVRSIFQDSKNNYWFGTDRDGVYYSDGKRISWYNEKHGLVNNQVRTIQEDEQGNIWFGTGYGVSKFDGKTFATITPTDSLPSIGTADENWKTTHSDLWFEASDRSGVYRYDGNQLTNLSMHKTDLDMHSLQAKSNAMNPYSVYTILKDKKGNVWFGTQTLGVCCYDGENFTWFSDKDLSGPAVRAIFEDSNGNMWFGNNGGGLFRYDGETVTNLTTENKLSNSQYLKNGQVRDELGTLARVWSINEDTLGNIWIGTIDAGVWQYDENGFTNYTMKNGLPSNVINIIYKDKKGELIFGTGESGVYKFNGESFIKCDFR